jgi:hypothetical protein
LKIAVEKLLRYAVFKAPGQIARLNYLDYTSQFLPGNKLQRYAGNRSEKPVATNRNSEQFVVFIARTANRFPIGIDQSK